MSIEKLKQISKAEEEAVSIRRQAQTEVRKMAEQGKKDAAGLLQKAREQADAAYQAKIRQAESEAQAAYDKRLAEVAEECQAMKSSAAGHLSDAVTLITGKVVNSIGIS